MQQYFSERVSIRNLAADKNNDFEQEIFKV